MSEKVHGRVSQGAESVTPVLPGVLQRTCACGTHTTGGDHCRQCQNAGVLQRKAFGASHASGVPTIVNDVLSSPGQPLGMTTRSFFEPRFGHDFSRVRVHSDVQAAESARAVDALAYTVGDHLVLGSGQFSPTSSRGRRVLAHELTHVLQQRSARPQAALELGAVGDAAEREANRLEKSIGDERASEDVVAAIRQRAGRTTLQRYPADDQPRERRYTVKKGETLAQIATTFGVSVESLENANRKKLKRWPARNAPGFVWGFNAGEEITIPPASVPVASMPPSDAVMEDIRSNRATMPRVSTPWEPSAWQERETAAGLVQGWGQEQGTPVGPAQPEIRSDPKKPEAKEKIEYSLQLGGGFEKKLANKLEKNFREVRKEDRSATFGFNIAIPLPLVTAKEGTLWGGTTQRGALGPLSVTMGVGAKEDGDWLISLLTEAAINIYHFEWKREKWNVEAELSGAGSAEYPLQTPILRQTPTFQAGGEIGLTGTYTFAEKGPEKGPFSLGLESKLLVTGEARDGKATIEFSGMSFGIKIILKYTFGQRARK